MIDGQPTGPAVVIVSAVLLNGAFLETTMAGEDISIRETSQPEISGHLVGVSNIWERELPDADGLIENRPSASVTIQDLVTKQTQVVKVIVGSVLSLGADNYKVISIEEGKAAPGAIVLHKLE
jgi:hypothetical protein